MASCVLGASIDGVPLRAITGVLWQGDRERRRIRDRIESQTA